MIGGGAECESPVGGLSREGGKTGSVGRATALSMLPG